MLQIQRIHFIIILLLAFPCWAEAQYYNLSFRNYASNTGLSQSEVNCVFEDRNGMLWIGTSYGLTLYDGKEFKKYYKDINDSTSIGGNIITDIAQDKKGFLWFSIYNSGISRLNPVNKKFENFQPSKNKKGIISSKISSLLVAADDKVWAASPQGLSVYDGKTGIFYNIPSLSTGQTFQLTCMEKTQTDMLK